MKNKGQFKKGYTWRTPRPFWNKDWLKKEYAIKSAADIAREQNCHENNILFWLNKHKIKTRTISETRKLKYWGPQGKKNPMYGKVRKLNPNWKGGCSPERQSQYARFAWKELVKSILERDKYTCQKCEKKPIAKRDLIIHHIKSWNEFSELRFDSTNLITLCGKCHKNVHKH